MNFNLSASTYLRKVVYDEYIYLTRYDSFDFFFLLKLEPNKRFQFFLKMKLEPTYMLIALFFLRFSSIFWFSLILIVTMNNLSGLMQGVYTYSHLPLNLVRLCY